MARSWQLAALALSAVAACRSKPRGTERDTALAEAPRPRQLLASAPFFRLEAEAAPCPRPGPCEVALVLSALGDYKLNKEYPFKLVPHAHSDVTARHIGRLERSGNQRGVMKLELDAPALPATFTGMFKLSVCTDDVCEIADPEISVALQATPR